MFPSRKVNKNAKPEEKPDSKVRIVDKCRNIYQTY